MNINEQVAALWDGLGDKWSHIAIDSGGGIYAYTAEPIKTGNVWKSANGEYRCLQQVTYDEVYTRPDESAKHTAPKAAAPAYTAEQLRGLVKNVVGEELENALLLTAEMIDLIHPETPKP